MPHKRTGLPTAMLWTALEAESMEYILLASDASAGGRDSLSLEARVPGAHRMQTAFLREDWVSGSSSSPSFRAPANHLATGHLLYRTPLQHAAPARHLNGDGRAGVGLVKTRASVSVFPSLSTGDNRSHLSMAECT
jgi:hypothetical protein